MSIDSRKDLNRISKMCHCITKIPRGLFFRLPFFPHASFRSSSPPTKVSFPAMNGRVISSIILRGNSTFFFHVRRGCATWFFRFPTAEITTATAIEAAERTRTNGGLERRRKRRIFAQRARKRVFETRTGEKLVVPPTRTIWGRTAR